MFPDDAGLRALARGLNLLHSADGLARGRPCRCTHGKFWTWRSPHLDAALLHAPVEAAEARRAAGPATFLAHPHDADHPCVLVRAGRIDPGRAAARLAARWPALAPKHRLRDGDAGRAWPPG